MGCTGGSKEKAINPFTKIPSLTQRQEGVCVGGGGGGRWGTGGEEWKIWIFL